MKNIQLIIWPLFIILVFTGCMTASEHRQAVRDDETERLTVGKVQREIRVGMSSAEVVEALGSPNIVSTDEKRREVWVYDKIATEEVYSTTSGGVSALILAGFAGGDGAAGAGGIPGFSKSTGATSKTQRTLTIIIKYNEENKVRDFAYRQSTF